MRLARQTKNSTWDSQERTRLYRVLQLKKKLRSLKRMFAGYKCSELAENQKEPLLGQRRLLTVLI